MDITKPVQIKDAYSKVAAMLQDRGTAASTLSAFTLLLNAQLLFRLRLNMPPTPLWALFALEHTCAEPLPCVGASINMKTFGVTQTWAHPHRTYRNLNLILSNFSVTLP